MSALNNELPLTNLPEVTEFSKYALFTDYVELDYKHKETPVSIMMVAPVGEGKSSVGNQFNGNKGLLYIDNVTAWGLEQKYLKELREGTIKRILIPDFIDPMNRKKATVDSTITLFNKLISWEGIKEVQTYAMSFSLPEPLHCSILTSMALGDFLRMVKTLAAVGFLSRLMLIGYKYSREQLDAVLEDIILKKASWEKILLDLPDEPVRVELDNELALRMKPLALELGQRISRDKSGGEAIRAYHQLAIMVKGKALSEKRDTVNANDIDRLMYLAERYVNNVQYIKPREGGQDEYSSGKGGNENPEAPQRGITNREISDRLEEITEKIKKGDQ